MKVQINPQFVYLESWIRSIHRKYPLSGQLLYSGRNVIKSFYTDGSEIVVKRYKHPDLFHAVVYTFFQKSKAQRAYIHAQELIQRGFQTPTPIAWCECYRYGLLTDAYLFTLRTRKTPFTEAARKFPAPSVMPVVNAFIRYTISLHEAGIEHLDFNHSNILFERHDDHDIRFELIDINRMKFHPKPLTPKQCVVNLKRLFCPTIPYLYVLKHYAELRGWDEEKMLLHGTFLRLRFSYFKNLKHRIFPKRKK